MDYVQYDGSVPELNPFTVCVWLRPGERSDHKSYAVMSYCTSGSKSCETLLLLRGNHVTTVIIAEDLNSPHKFASLKITQWTHTCIVMSRSVSQYYINGSLSSRIMKTIDKGVPGGGVLILGNIQGNQMNGSSVGEPISNGHGFLGELKEFQLWNKELDAKEIHASFESGGCSCNGDSIVNFNERNSRIKGNVEAVWNVPCP